MTKLEVLGLAEDTAGKVGIIIKNQEAILKRMYSSKFSTTILCNEKYTLWIDKDYIAYSDNDDTDVWYKYITLKHINESFVDISQMLDESLEPDDKHMQSGIQKQMCEALHAMADSKSVYYIFTYHDSIVGNKKGGDKGYRKLDDFPACASCAVSPAMPIIQKKCFWKNDRRPNPI
jgi:hypothetical protein